MPSDVTVRNPPPNGKHFLRRLARLVVRASLHKLEEEERWKAYAKAKIAKGLEDVAAGRIISREDFLEEIKQRRRKKTA